VSFEENAEEEDDPDMEIPEAEAKLSIWDEVKICAARPLFVWSTLGYAAYSGGIIGFSTYGPQFVMGLGYYKQEFTVIYVSHLNALFLSFLIYYNLQN
jgi:hypothetical protein